MDRLFQACSHTNEEVVVNVLTCLREITIQEYDYIQYYFEKIGTITFALAMHPSSRVGAQAFEYWTTLVEEETERLQKKVTCLNYVKSCQDNLIQLILEGLCILNFEEDEDEGEWGHMLSASCCLQKLALLIKNDVMDKVI